MISLSLATVWLKSKVILVSRHQQLRVLPLAQTLQLQRKDAKRISEAACLGHGVQCLGLGNHNYITKLGEVSNHTEYQDQTLTHY